MHNKFKKCTLIFFLTSILFVSLIKITAFGVDNTYKLLKCSKDVDIKKEWKINFNEILDKNTVKNNIKLLEEDSKREIHIEVKYNLKDKFITLKPLNNLKYNSKYTILIKKNIKSHRGKNLLQDVKFNFKTKSLEDYYGINVNSKQEFYNILRESIDQYKTYVKLNINNYNSKDYSLHIINDILRENPLIDYGYKGISGEYNINGKNAIMDLKIEYFYPKEKMEYMKNKSKEKTDYIIKTVIKDYMSDYEKELAVHDYLVKNSSYDRRLFSGNMPQESYTDYGILVNGVGVCEGYAKAMYRILNSIGIETLFVTGQGVYNDGSVESHTWNIVKIDGEYYQVDVTLDNPLTSNGRKEILHDYFNISDKKMRKDHIWDSSLYPKCNKERYNLKKLVA